MEWGLVILLGFALEGAIAVFALLAIKKDQRESQKILQQMLIRTELIHEYLLYKKQQTYSAIPTPLLEEPNARSEAAKKRWAKKKASKQQLEKAPEIS